jgi:hypothetical protein
MLPPFSDYERVITEYSVQFYQSIQLHILMYISVAASAVKNSNVTDVTGMILLVLLFIILMNIRLLFI